MTSQEQQPHTCLSSGHISAGKVFYGLLLQVDSKYLHAMLVVQVFVRGLFLLCRIEILELLYLIEAHKLQFNLNAHDKLDLAYRED